jgi:hypothetical protein
VGYSSSTEPRFNDLYADWIWHMVASEEHSLRRHKRILFLASKAPRQSYCASIFYTKDAVRQSSLRQAEAFEEPVGAEDDGASQASDSVLDDGSDASSCSTAMTELTTTAPDKSCSKRAASTRRETATKGMPEDLLVRRSDHDYFNILCNDIGLALDRMAPPVTDAGHDGIPDAATPRELFPIINNALVDSIQSHQQTSVSSGSSRVRRVARKIRACECMHCSFKQHGVYLLDNETLIDDMLFELQPETSLRLMSASKRADARPAVNPEIQHRLKAAEALKAGPR